MFHDGNTLHANMQPAVEFGEYRLKNKTKCQL